MNRRIQTVSYNVAGATAESADKYTDKIVKLIPTEVVAGWIAVNSIIVAASQHPRTGTLILLFIVFAVFAAAYTWKQTSEKSAPKPYIQTAVSTFAFAVWAYAIGGPFPQWVPGLYDALFGGILLIVFTLASGLVPHA